MQKLKVLHINPSLKQYCETEHWQELEGVLRWVKPAEWLKLKRLELRAEGYTAVDYKQFRRNL